MLVQELINKLQEFPPYLKVIVVSDHGQTPTDLDTVELSRFIETSSAIDILHHEDSDGTEPKAVILWA